MTAVVRPEILSSLATVREDVQRHVAELSRYRALQAIEKTIADFPELDDLSRSLSEVRDRVQEQLQETREFRALRAVERILPELSDVLAFLAERAEPAPAQAPAAEEDGAAPVAAVSETVTVASGDHADGVDIEAIETATAILTLPQEDAESTEEDSDVIELPTDPHHRPTSDAEDGAPTFNVPNPSALAAQGAPSGEGAPPSLAYSLAQMMVQAMTPPAQPSHDPGPDAAHSQTGEAGPAADDAEPPAAGKAA